MGKQAAKESLWKLGGLSWAELGKRVWGEIDRDDVFGRSAQLAYYFLLALFPLMLFLMSVFGVLAGPGSQLREALLSNLSRGLPPQAAQLITQVVDQTAKAAGGWKMIVGVLGALWAASAGMAALTETLNVVYNVREDRPWWKKRGTALWLTVAVSVLIVTSLVLVLYGGKIADLAGSYLGLGSVFTLGWKIAQWPLGLFFMAVSFGLIYYFAPNLQHQKWYWVSPGSAVGLALWIVATFAFRIYLHFFNSYSATYGSLGAVIILMLWFYLSGASVLIGGEINSEIENAAAEHGVPEAKHKGEKQPARESRAA